MKVIDALTRDGRNARADLDGASSAGGFATEADVLRALHTGTCIPGPGAATGPGPGIRVRVHYNLHRGGFSVVSRTTGRVIGHAGDITLADVEFRVQQGTLARIRAEGRRAVCAYAIGTVTAINTRPGTAGLPRVTFSPWRADTFTLDGHPVRAAPAVIFADRAGWLPPCTTASGA